MSSTSIPEDAVDAILDEIPLGDRSTFLSCSMVARSFVAPSQARLFRQIYLYPYQDRCRRLHNLLTQSPHLAQYIRALILEPDPPPARGPSTDYENWIFSEPDLRPCLDLLSNLRTLSVAPQDHQMTLDWRDFPPNSQASFLRLFQFPSLIKIDIENMKVPASIFCYSAQLKELRLRDCSVVHTVSVNNSDPKAVLEKPHLQSLLITAGPLGESLLKNLSITVDLTNLRELILTGIDEATLDMVGSFMKHSAPHLQRFQWTISELRYDPDDDYDRPKIRLQIPKTLRSLEVGSLTSADDPQSPVVWALRALQDLVTRHSGPVSLEDVTIGFIAEFFGCMGMEYLKMDPVWRDLDVVLSNEEVFANLKRVTILLSGGWDEEDLREQFLEVMPGHIMIGLEARGILDMSTRKLFTDELREQLNWHRLDPRSLENRALLHFKL
ncbi:hypothetical protein FPV67DRAFT_1448823 [Lyophyllum atratum]|nr:hypothetical protein FPV67DRAFT_1448823 [Lyophyllum atratum]